MKILIVDDSRIMRRIISGAVGVLGYDFLEAGDGEIALSVLEKEVDDVGLVTLDWNMPNMDGLETLKAIKANPRFAHLPVLVITTEAEKERMIAAIQAGAKNYMCKPFTQPDLTTKIMECLGIGMDFL